MEKRRIDGLSIITNDIQLQSFIQSIHRPWQINGHETFLPLYYSPSSPPPTTKWLFHFLKRRGGLPNDSPGELQWAASPSVCLQGNPDIPFQIHLDSSAFINQVQANYQSIRNCSAQCASWNHDAATIYLILVVWLLGGKNACTIPVVLVYCG